MNLPKSGGGAAGPSKRTGAGGAGPEEDEAEDDAALPDGCGGCGGCGVVCLK